MDGLDWNDLRLVAAIAREGSAAGAARALGVSLATVLRRTQAAEEAIGAGLFARLPTGYAATEAGLTLADVGEALQSALDDAYRRIEARNASLSGAIRFTTTDSLAQTVMPSLLAAFAARYPEVSLDVVSTNQSIGLARGVADVTLRPSRSPDETLVGMRLMRMDFGLYAARALADRHPGRPWQEFDFILPEGPLESAPAFQWLSSARGNAPARMRASSFLVLRELARGGAGVTILPHFLAVGDPALTLLAPAPTAASADVWLLTHAENRQSSRITAFIDHISHGLRRQRALFEAPVGAD